MGTIHFYGFQNNLVDNNDDIFHKQTAHHSQTAKT